MAKSIKKSMALKGNKNAEGKGHARIGGLFASVAGPFGAFQGGVNAGKVANKKKASAHSFTKETAKGTSAAGLFHGALIAGVAGVNPIAGAALGAASYAGLTYTGSKITVMKHGRHKN